MRYWNLILTKTMLKIYVFYNLFSKLEYHNTWIPQGHSKIVQIHMRHPVVQSSISQNQKRKCQNSSKGMSTSTKVRESSFKHQIREMSKSWSRCSQRDRDEIWWSLKGKMLGTVFVCKSWAELTDLCYLMSPNVLTVIDSPNWRDQ